MHYPGNPWYHVLCSLQRWCGKESQCRTGLSANFTNNLLSHHRSRLSTSCCMLLRHASAAALVSHIRGEPRIPGPLSTILLPGAAPSGASFSLGGAAVGRIYRYLLSSILPTSPQSRLLQSGYRADDSVTLMVLFTHIYSQQALMTKYSQIACKKTAATGTKTSSEHMID